MKRLKMTVAMLCCIILMLTMSACGNDKKNSSGKTDNDTTPKPVTKSITCVKGYVQTPISTSDMAKKWNVDTYYEEFEFDNEGKCTAFTRYCSICSADNSETVKAHLAEDGITAAWLEGNKSFTMTLDEMKGKDVAFAKEYFDNTLTPYIIQYIDSENDVSSEVFGEGKDRSNESEAVKSLFGLGFSDIKGEWDIVSVNKKDAVWEMESKTGMTFDDANACMASVLKLVEFDMNNLKDATEEAPTASLTYEANGVSYEVTVTLTGSSTIIFRMEKK